MKTCIITSAILLASSLLTAQSSAVFAQMLPVKAGQTLCIELDQPYTVKPHAGTTVLVEIFVNLYNGGSQTLRHLNAKGQYRLLLSSDCKGMTLNDTDLRPLATVNGAPLRETVSYVIYVPEGVAVAGKEEVVMLASR